MNEIKIDPKALGLREDISEKEIADVLLERFKDNGKTGTPNPELEKEARALLLAPQLVDRYIRLMCQLGQVGEEANAKLLLIAGVSRINPAPIATTVKGKSGSGKTTLVERGLKIYPVDAVHKVTRLTPQALFYLRNKDLRHTILFVAEALGAEGGDYPVRVMISEQELILWVTTKKEGQIATEEIRIPGPVAFIQTTTKATLNPEGETRWFSIWTDEGEPLTRQVSDNLGERLAKPQPPPPERELKTWQLAMTMLRSLPVLVPFAPKITQALPTKKVRVRRDAARFLAIIETSALLHQYQRELKTHEGQEYIIAAKADYDFPHSIAGPVLKESYRELPARLEDFLTLLIEKCPTIFTRRDIQQHTPLTTNTLNQYLAQLVDLGHLEVVDGKKGQLQSYNLLTTELDPVTLPEAETLFSPYTGYTGCPPISEPLSEESLLIAGYTGYTGNQPVKPVNPAIHNPLLYLGPDSGVGGVEPVKENKESPPPPCLNDPKAGCRFRVEHPGQDFKVCSFESGKCPFYIFEGVGMATKEEARFPMGCASPGTIR